MKALEDRHRVIAPKSAIARVAFALLLALPLAAGAQPMGRGPGFMHPPPFMDDVFRPELIMRYQRDIGLTDEQEQAIRKAMSETRNKLDDLQWQFEAKSQDLAKLVEAPKIDETQALAELDRMLQIEEQMKRLHFALLVKIKNELTAEQHAKLRELRKKDGGPRRGGFHRGRPPGGPPDGPLGGPPD